VSFQAEKDLVRAFHSAVDAAGPAAVSDVLAGFVSADWLWRGMHPFHEQRGAAAVAAAFWQPLKSALARMQRRDDIFLAGRNEIDGFQSVWVVSMGHLMGLLDAPWLGIPPTGKMALLRYCEFNRVEGGRITETALFCDIPHLMIQAGVNPFPPQTAAHLVQPGPMTHTGLMYGPQDEAEGEATLAAINHMIGALGNWGSGLSLEDELALSWNDDMIWWGPAGIGATYTIERYARQHSGPFRAAFRDRRFNGHLCRLAEGEFGGFFGWPNLTLTHRGGFMGLPGNSTPADMRVVDIYRRGGAKLSENWVFIDIPHWLNMQGMDVLSRR
jgi:hypothetical protein